MGVVRPEHDGYGWRSPWGDNSTGGQSAPYGYNRIHGKGAAKCPTCGSKTGSTTLIRNAAEQKALRLIRRLRARGMSFQRISEELVKRQIRTRQGGWKWHTSYLSKILRRS